MPDNDQLVPAGGDRNYEITADMLHGIRYAAWDFVANPTKAPDLWQRMAHDDPVWAPPAELERIPLAQRAAWIARQHAEVFERARLYFVDATAVDVVAQLGARAIDTGLTGLPPAPYGLLVCPEGLGYSLDGMRIIAASWRPWSEGYWISWWADSREYFDAVVVPLDGGPDARLPKYLFDMGHLHLVTGAYATVDQYDSARLGVTIIADDPPGVDPQTALDDAPGEFIGVSRSTVGVFAAVATGAVASERLPADPTWSERCRSAGLLPSRITRVFAHPAEPSASS